MWAFDGAHGDEGSRNVAPPNYPDDWFSRMAATATQRHTMHAPTQLPAGMAPHWAHILLFS